MKTACKSAICAVLIFAVLFCCASCGKSGTDVSDGNTVEMVIKGYGTVTIALNRDEAPLTVDHFLKLVNDGSYDGTVFTRVQAGFVLQGGDGCSDTSTVKGEFRANGVDNDIEHKKGVISMARTTVYDSASSQFFIVLDDSAQSSLDGSYAAFGEVTGGWDVIEKLCSDIKVSDFSDDYYGQVMGFLKESSYITIESMRVAD